MAGEEIVERSSTLNIKIAYFLT